MLLMLRRHWQRSRYSTSEGQQTLLGLLQAVSLLEGCEEIGKPSKNMHKLCPGYLSDVNVDCCL